MNRQAELAREWAEQNYPEWVKIAEGTLAADLLEKAKAAAEYILAHTTPPTMADVRWDHDTMPGTGALTENGDLWIMRDDAGDSIDCISPDLVEIAFVAKDFLTPNGKRYELREVPDHPEILETYKDFRDAPEGTIVARYGMAPWWKTDDDTWERGHNEASDAYMASKFHTLKVLRWGDEA